LATLRGRRREIEEELAAVDVPAETVQDLAEWAAELRAVRDDLAKGPRLGVPRRDGSCQPAFTIYAWNEFGEGGVVAPTQGEGAMKLEAINDVFGGAGRWAVGGGQ
jgi:hypothetical protein